MNKIAIIGLGYVGFPLAKLFASKYTVIGFDIDSNKVSELNSSNEASTIKRIIDIKTEVKTGLFLTSKLQDLKDCNIFIVTVPTPVDKNNNPDLSPLLEASEFVGQVIKKGDIVIYESTVYPGATEEDCIPVIEKVSRLKFNRDFYGGYSPERINPGDDKHTIENIKKITSGSTPGAARIINDLYSSVITGGTYMASSIKVAEASKVIENTQRDINIAFINEVKKILDKLDIDTKEVLEAASTKWNFVTVKPGLVGGHCIGVDPYYLVQKAMRAGYIPELILSARRVNDSMSTYVAHQTLQKICSKGNLSDQSKILVLGFTFKENCSDIRNSKVKDIISVFDNCKIKTTIYDPHADPKKVKEEYNIDIVPQISEDSKFDAIIIAVNHKEFKEINWSSHLNKGGFTYSLENYHSSESI